MSSSPRIDWVDVAKGLAICLVALYHSALISLQLDLAAPRWETVNQLFATFRMPLFFLASGLFAGSVVRRSWPALWSTRVSLLVWCFCLWTVIRFGYFSLIPCPERPWETDVDRLVEAPLHSSGGLWFLQALVVFFVLAKAMGSLRVPPTAQVVAAAAVSVLNGVAWDLPELSWDKMATYFAFFLIGCHHRDLIARWAIRARTTHVVVGGVVFLGVSLVVLRRDLDDVVGVTLAVSLVAVATGIALAAVLARTPLVGPLSFLGRNTLPIYVSHVILIVFVLTGLRQVVDAPQGLLAYAIPLGVAVTAVAGALLLWMLANRGVGRYLYACPPFLRGDRSGRRLARSR